MKQFVEKDAKGPNIDVMVVLSFEKHFRCHVLIGAAKSSTFEVDVLGSPPEIAYFDIPVAIEQ